MKRMQIALILVNFTAMAALVLGAGPACSPGVNGSDSSNDDNRYEKNYSLSDEAAFCATLPTEEEIAECEEILATGAIARCGVDCGQKPLEERLECIEKYNSMEFYVAFLNSCLKDPKFSGVERQCVREVDDLCNRYWEIDLPRYEQELEEQKAAEAAEASETEEPIEIVEE